MSTVEVHKQITADEIAHTFEDEVPKAADLGQYAVEDWLALAIFWIMALCVFLQFFTRYVLNDSYAWTEEIATYCLIGVVFHRLGDVRAAVAAHPGRPAVPLSAACCRRACAFDRDRPDPDRVLRIRDQAGLAVHPDHRRRADDDDQVSKKASSITPCCSALC